MAYTRLTSIFDTVSDWETGVSFIENDIVSYGDNIYYCLVSHVSDNGNYPSIGSDKWGGRILYGSQDKPNFIWKPSYNSGTDNEPRVRTIRFGDGYEQRSGDGINNILLKCQCTFDLRDEKETLAIIHFLTERAGIESFIFSAPKPFGFNKKFKCSSFNEKYLFYDNHTIIANFEEVPE